MFLPSQENTTWTRVLLNTRNHTVLKQKSTKTSQNSLNDNLFKEFFVECIEIGNEFGGTAVIQKLRMPPIGFTPHQKRVVISMSHAAKRLWIALPNITQEEEEIRKLFKCPLSKNTILVQELKKFEKEDFQELLLKMHEGQFNEFTNTIFGASVEEDNRAVFDPILPQAKSEKPTLILDIDETMLHSELAEPEKYDLTCKIEYQKPNAENSELFGTHSQPVYINIRPHLPEFLELMSKEFEIVTWTASLQTYADDILDQIDPAGKVSYRLYRQHCDSTSAGSLMKDLRRLGRDLRRTVMIDNSCLGFAFTLNNGIPCFPFTDDRNDRELLSFIPILAELKSLKDFRPFLQKMYRLEEIKEKILEVTKGSSEAKFTVRQVRCNF
jgi:CTD small phosphatase-like protein 2